MALVLDTSALAEFERSLTRDAPIDVPWEEAIVIPAIAVAATARSLRFGVLVGPADEAHFLRGREMIDRPGVLSYSAA